MPELLCSRCSKRLRVGEEYQGKRIRCKCGNTIDVLDASLAETTPLRVSSTRINRRILVIASLVVAAVGVGIWLGDLSRNSTNAMGDKRAAEIHALFKKDANDKVWLRDDFRSSIMGLDQNEVIAAVGKPDSTQESGEDQIWYYARKTRDPITDKIDGNAQVIFQRGIVVRVNY